MANNESKMTEKEYTKLMGEIDALMKKGDENLTDQEASQLRKMAEAAQAYEKSIYHIPAPSTIEGMVELRMYEMKLKQKDAAKILGVAEPKLSQILNGIRKPDVAFLKAARKQLNIDADFLLEHA